MDNNEYKFMAYFLHFQHFLLHFQRNTGTPISNKKQTPMTKDRPWTGQVTHVFVAWYGSIVVTEDFAHLPKQKLELRHSFYLIWCCAQVLIVQNRCFKPFWANHRQEHSKINAVNVVIGVLKKIKIHKVVSAVKVIKLMTTTVIH